MVQTVGGQGMMGADWYCWICRLTAVHLACIYIAAKNVEFVPYKRLLSTMLSHIYNGEPPADAAPQLELEVLHALEWRLGPFFRPVHAA